MTLGTAGEIQAGFSDFGAAANALFGAKGNKINAEYERKAAATFTEAAALARKNEEYATESTRIQQLQADRSIAQTIGGQQADVAGAGFGASGSALDLLADSEKQGELTKHLLTVQGEINVNAYEQQAKSYEAQATSQEGAAKASDVAAKAGKVSGAISAVAGVAQFAMFASDRRLKTDIKQVGVMPNGLAIYTFRFKDQGATQIGFMADEVQKLHPEAVREINGYLHVDYEMAVR